VPRLRVSPADQAVAAIEDLLSLTSDARGIDIAPDADDLVKVGVGSKRWPAKVIVREAISRRDIEFLLETEARGNKVIVANRISAAAKELLEEHNASQKTFGWSWLDRRGELQLQHPEASGVITFDEDRLAGRTHAALRRGTASPGSDGSIRGRAGLSYAAALLLSHADHRHDRPSIRAVAGAAGMSHGAVGDASKLLRESGLVRPSGEPQTPELFWALADVWGPARLVPVASLPRPSDETRLQMQVGELDEPGWANGGDAAAAAWGAPVFDAGAQPRIWVPTDAVARRAERTVWRCWRWRRRSSPAATACGPTGLRHRTSYRPSTRCSSPSSSPRTRHAAVRSSSSGTSTVPRSNVSGDPDEILLADHHHALVEAARAVLATSDLPPVVLIGGLAVAMRVGSTGQPHRATIDIDLVTTETDPAAVEILADAHDSARQPLVIEGVKVDLIATMEASATDLADLDDDDRLFVAGHRWAFETGVLTVVRVAGGEPLAAQVATPAGLVATKSHAIAAPSTLRRSTKMPADLLDLYRLVERYDRRGAVSQEIRTVPGEIAAVIASVVEREILANPAAATNKMRSASLSPVDPVEVVDVMETFVEDLRRV
jgi:hypothetical protein